uniref:F-box domain-containing protein n=1 Tax=Kwoniella bestiolae CBS 10118 TaxID=1296100 RepID=A0A1B9G3A5_9TREE|nr:hypothetical protein I302_05301 [Kwoniella bestiolae CBS 10118]OCF25481.1 hypothetical protein I302_05301 [Kwoniella bestiolae CBS 10118]
MTLKFTVTSNPTTLSSLDSHLLEKIILHLSIQDLISLSQVSQWFLQLVRDTPSVQYKLYSSLYQCTPSPSSMTHPSNPTKKILDLVEKERNIIRLTPRIGRFGIGRAERVHSVMGNWLITIPTTSLDPGNEGADKGKDGYELCRVYKLDRPGYQRVIKTQYNPILETLLVDIKRDLVVYADQEGFVHLLDFQKEEELVMGGTEIPLEDWIARKSLRMNLVKGDKLVVDLGARWLVYDSGEGSLQHRFPPRTPWDSCHGSIITSRGLLVGLDVPSIPWAPNNKPKEAYLAIFNLSSPPSAPYHPELLLELPYSHHLLSKTVRSLPTTHIPKNIKIVSSDQPPSIHQAQYNPSFIRIDISFKTTPYNAVHTAQREMRLEITIPMKQLNMIKFENIHRKVWVKGRTWRRGNNPFDGVESIKFGDWSHRCFLDIQCTSSSRGNFGYTGYTLTAQYRHQNKGRDEDVGCQVGRRMFSVANALLVEKGWLKIDIRDFDHREIKNEMNGFGAVRGVQLDQPPRDGEAQSGYLPSTSVCSGHFRLGIPGGVERMVGDDEGQKLVIQQKGNDKVWIIDFGA